MRKKQKQNGENSKRLMSEELRQERFHCFFPLKVQFEQLQFIKGFPVQHTMCLRDPHIEISRVGFVGENEG